MNKLRIKTWLVLYGICWAFLAFWIFNEWDFWFANHLFALEGKHWTLKDYWLLKTYLHDGLHKVVLISSLLLFFVFFGYTIWGKSSPEARSIGWYFFSNLALTSLFITLLKQATGVECPWDLSLYEGTKEYLSFGRSIIEGNGKCFPAGHAGSAYSFIAVYYALAFSRWKAYRTHALTIVITFGVMMGLVQQLRGAHFISHDMASFLIAWGIARISSYWWFRE